MLSVKQGQCTEEDIFGNLDEPGSFDDFLNVLGEYTRLSSNREMIPVFCLRDISQSIGPCKCLNWKFNASKV